MENSNFDRPRYEPRPGFNIPEKPYGDTVAFNFNLEFARRLNNVLSDLNKSQRLQDSQAAFLKELAYLLDDNDETEPEESKDFLINRFNQVFVVACARDFGHDLAEILDSFIVGRNVSPALFSFVKQFQAHVLGLPRTPKESQSRRYADD